MALTRRDLMQRIGLAAGGLGFGLLPRLAEAQDPKLGYSDTPIIPGTKWHVHDGMRPQPTVVTPNPGTVGWLPPSDAVVLFDGKNLDAWTHGGGAAKWKVEDGAFVVAAGTGPMETRESFGDVQLHIEYSAPSPARGQGQGRGNSGVFFHGDLYEVQVLDSYQAQTYPDGQAGALYGQYPPLYNANRKPGEWNIYDIVFMNPLWDGATLVRPAMVTVFMNGVLLHNAKALLGPTLHRQVGVYKPHPREGKISLQDHGNPVRYRNVWLRRLHDYDQP